MKRKLFFVAMLVASALGFNANAQTDVTDKYLVNPSFEIVKASDGVTDLDFTRAENNPSNPIPSLTNGLYGWDVPALSNYNVESEASGSNSGFLATDGGSIKPSDGEYYYFNRQGWLTDGNFKNTELKTTTKAAVEPGVYYLSFDYKAADYSNENNAGRNGTTIGVTVQDASNSTLGTTKAVRRSYSMTNGSSNPQNNPYMQTAPWTQMGVYFEVKSASVLTFAVQQNMKNNGRSDIAYDNFRLYKLDGTEDVDMTGIIANPSFEAGHVKDAGWSTSPAVGGEVGVKSVTQDNKKYDFSNSDGNYIFNTWVNGGQSYYIQQSIGLPSGKYQLSAVIASGENREISFGAGMWKQVVTTKGDGVGVPVTVELELDENYDGLDVIVHSTSYFKVDDFKLTFVKTLYSVNVSEDIENGTVTAEPTAAKPGETVTLTVTPADGYELDELTVTYGEDNTPVEVADGYTFTMPEDDVTVSATFAEVEVPLTGFIGDGIYYLYNENTGKFLSRGSWWGTRAVADEYGLPINVKLEDGAYTLMGIDNNLYYGDDYWMYADCSGDRPRKFTIKEVEGMKGTYTLAVAAPSDSKTLGKTLYINVIDGTGDFGVANNAEDEPTNDIKNSYWQFLSVEEYAKIQEKKTAAIAQTVADKAGVENFDDFEPTGEPVVLSFVDGETNWKNDATSERGGGVAKGTYGTEVYQGTQKFTQFVGGLEEGLYLVSIQGFFRDGWNENVAALYDEGYDCVVAYLDANGATVRIANWAEEATQNGDAWVPNNVTEAKALFDGGKYIKSVVTYVGADGTLDLTVMSDALTVEKGGDWLILNNVTYTKLAIPGEEDVTLETAKENANKALDRLAPVGNGPFQYSPEAIEAARAAIEAAETVDEVKAVEMPTKNAPDPTQPYAFTLKTSKGTWTLSMENGIKVVHSQSEMFCDAVLYTGTPIYLVPQANNTYALANRPGDASVYDFVNYEGSNNWTLKASTSDVTTPYGWTITALPNGGYTITGKNGFLGTNTSDGNDVQSPCYGDKKANNGNYIWSITPIPSVEPLYADTPLTSEMFQVWDGTDAKAAPTGDEPTWDAPAFGIKCAEGETLYGNAAVDSLEYADITGARTLRIVGTPGLVTRVMLNARKVVHKVDDVVPAGAKIGYEVDGDTVVKAYIELNPTIAPNGVVDIDLTPYAYVHLNAINVQVGSAGAVYDLVLDPTTVVPEVVSIDLTKEMFKGWDGVGADANIVSNYPFWDAKELGTTIDAGEVVYGNSNVDNKEYADISAADVLRIEGDPGLSLRVLINRQLDNSLTEINPTIGKEGYVDVDLTSYEYVHLNSIKVNWGSSGVVSALTLLINNEPALPNNVYEGYIAARLSHPAVGEMAKKTDTQTVIIADVVDGMTSITFSNIDVAPMVLSELTIDNVAVTENADGSVSYSCKDVTITRQNGMMTTNYNVSLTGTKASADATPVLTLTVAQAMELTVVFAATKEEAEAPLAGLVQGVDSIGTDAVKSNGKYLENGKIVIIRNGVKYNVNGTIVK